MKGGANQARRKDNWYKKLGLSWANWDIFIPVINNSPQAHTDPVNLLQTALAKVSYILMHIFSLIWEHFVILSFSYIYWFPRRELGIRVQHWRKQIPCLLHGHLKLSLLIKILTLYDMANVLGGSTWISITKLSCLDRKCVVKLILNR